MKIRISSSLEVEQQGDQVWLWEVGTPVLLMTHQEALKLADLIAAREIKTRIKLDSGTVLLGEEADKYLEKVGD